MFGSRSVLGQLRPFHQLSNSSSSSQRLSLWHLEHHLSTCSISEPQYEHMSLVEDFGADAEVFCFGGLLLLLKNDIKELYILKSLARITFFEVARLW